MMSQSPGADCPGSIAFRQEIDHVRVGRGEGGIQGGYPAPAATGQRGQPSIRHLAVPEHRAGLQLKVGERVVPEHMGGMRSDGPQRGPGGGGGGPRTELQV